MTLDPIRLSAAGLYNVAEGRSLADLLATYELDTDAWGSSVVGAGTATHVANESAIRCAVASGATDRARIETHERLRPRARFGLRVEMVGYASGAGIVNRETRWGAFSDDDGAGFQIDGTTIGLFYRSSASGSVVTTVVAKEAWNVTIPASFDVTKAHAYAIQIGADAVRWFVDGVLVHEYLHVGVLGRALFRRAEFPLAVDVENVGAVSGGGSFTLLEGSGEVEGGGPSSRLTFSASNAADVAIGTTEVPILSLRPAATFNAIAFRGSLVPRLLTVRAAAIARVRLLLNPTTLTGAAWAVADTRSAAERDITATAVSGGVELFAVPVGIGADPVAFDLEAIFGRLRRRLLTRALGGGADVLTVAAATAAGSSTARAGLTWGEIR